MKLGRDTFFVSYKLQIYFQRTHEMDSLALHECIFARFDRQCIGLELILTAPFNRYLSDSGTSWNRVSKRFGVGVHIYQTTCLKKKSGKMGCLLALRSTVENVTTFFGGKI